MQGYTLGCLGFKILRKLEDIVHEEQIRAGHIPMLMPTLQSADLWRESGRYEAMVRKCYGLRTDMNGICFTAHQ